MKSQFTPDSVSKLSDDELRIEVARKMWREAVDYRIRPKSIIGLFPSGKYLSRPDPLSPGGAFRLMVENKIDPMFVGETVRTVGVRSRPATLEGTARAICEAFVLMEK